MQTIDIRTSQNVTIEYELANLRERILAFIIDGLIIAVIDLIIVFLFLPIFGRGGNLFGNVFFQLLPIITLLLYQFLCELLLDGQSWGKKAIGIKVVRIDGRQAGLADYLIRMIFLIIDVVFGFGVPAAVLIATSAKNQRLGDMTAHTTVVRLRNRIHFQLDDILNIESMAGYEPTFPQVRSLGEEDMLIIKSCLNRYRTYKNDAHKLVLTELADHLRSVLVLERTEQTDEAFLKTLLRDYIVLTR